MTAHGELEIIPNANLGDMDEAKIIQAATINWKWYYSAFNLTVWILLILALVIPKSNHNINALFIFIPIPFLYFIWLILVKLTSMPSSSQTIIYPSYQAMVIGLAVLWLTAEYVKIFRGTAIFILSLLTIAIFLCIGVISSTGGLGAMALMYTLMFLVLTIGFFVAIALTTKICRKKYGHVRFMLWLALWTVIIAGLAIFILFIIYYTIVSAWSSMSSSIIISMLINITIIGLVCGLLIYVMNLPFMILGFVNPFFRKRFHSVIKLKSAKTDHEQLVPLDFEQGT